MAEEGLRVGQLVRSKAGRDAGLYFLIVGIKDSRFVAVADGKVRRVSHPKLKNVRHLEIYPVRMESADARFAAPSVVTDRAIAEAIRELLAGLGQPT
ncbi:MAG: RNA-binding protein [Bacillota bacterium]|jgi:ribosomal protein L14E/L6E/L27E|nr:MAG: RNA-binding protein [Bacillota bacterium]